MKPYEIFTEELKTKLLGFLQSEKTKEALEKIKESNESGSFQGMVISTEHDDRQGEMVLQKGMDSSFYMLNPVVTNSHRYDGIENIIGLTTRLYPGEVDGVKATLADGKWAPTEEGQLARKLWDGGFLNAASVGFMVKEFDPQNSKIITKWELLEFAFCVVPCNGKATRKKWLLDMGLTEDGLRAKGFTVIEEKEEPKEGDLCTMEDGTEGEMQADGDGKLVCMAKKAVKTEKQEKTKGEVSDQLDEEAKRKIKCENLRAMDNILYAFWDVYLDEKTEPTQFGPLLKEVIQLLAALVPADAVQASAVAERIKTIAGKTIEDILIKRGIDVLKEKSGKVLSEKNRTLISSSVSTMEQSIAALKELLAATEPQGDEGKSVKTDDPNKRSSDAGSDSEEILNQYFFVKQVLRSVSTAVSDALGKTKIKIKK